MKHAAMATLGVLAMVLSACGSAAGTGPSVQPTRTLVDYQGPIGPTPTESTSDWKRFATVFRQAMRQEAVGYQWATDPAILSKGTYHAEDAFKAAGDALAQAPSPDDTTLYNAEGWMNDEEVQAGDMAQALTPAQLAPYVQRIQADHRKLLAIESMLRTRGL